MREYKAPKGFTKVVDGERPVIDEGAPVYISPYYVAEGESPKKYLVMEVGSGSVLLADNKRMLNKGEGYLYSIWNIEYYKNF